MAKLSTEARRAIASAEGFADAYAALGYALFYGTLDIAAADAPYEKAHELANGSADVLSLYALYRSRRGQFDRARSAIGRAQTLDPLNPGLFKSAGRIRFASGDYAGAIALARQALEINPAIGGAHGDIGNALLMLGSVDEASAEFAKEKVHLLSIPGRHSSRSAGKMPRRPAKRSKSWWRSRATTGFTSRLRSSPSGGSRNKRSTRWSMPPPSRIRARLSAHRSIP